jgi:hypothetical protein
MPERRKETDRRRATRSGRRSGDPRDEPTVSEIRFELARLHKVIERLVDAVQSLTGALRKP